MKAQQLVTPDHITELKHHEVFVFGSNTGGLHRGGAAKLAHEAFGARWGFGEGLYGQSYALPTVFGDLTTHTIGPKLEIETIQEHVNNLIICAGNHPHLMFLVTEVGCGLAGWTVQDIAPLFREVLELKNVTLPQRFLDELFKEKE